MSTKHKSSRLLMGNWKMNGSLASNQVLLDGLLQGLQQQPTEHQVVVCAPFVYLAQAQSLLVDSPIAWGHRMSLHTTVVLIPVRLVRPCSKSWAAVLCWSVIQSVGSIFPSPTRSPRPRSTRSSVMACAPYFVWVKPKSNTTLTKPNRYWPSS